MPMIDAKEAVKAAQDFNRKCWLEQAGNELSQNIMQVSRQGIRELKVNFKDLIKGSENLYEAGEMLYYLNNVLDKAGFKHVISPAGVLHVSW